MSLLELITAFFLIAGTFFCFVASVGITRLPDIFLRIHASTKATTIGISCISIATAIHFGTGALIAKCALVVLFLLLTAPVSGHLIGRAARKRKNPMCERTVADEF